MAASLMSGTAPGENAELWQGILQVVKKKRPRSLVLSTDNDHILETFSWRLLQAKDGLELICYSSLSATPTPIGKVSILSCSLDATLPTKFNKVIENPAERLLLVESKRGLKIFCAENAHDRDQLYDIIVSSLGTDAVKGSGVLYSAQYTPDAAEESFYEDICSGDIQTFPMFNQLEGETSIDYI